MALIDFTLSNARRFYSSMGNPLGLKGLMHFLTIPLGPSVLLMRSPMAMAPIKEDYKTRS